MSIAYSKRTRSEDGSSSQIAGRILDMKDSVFDGNRHPASFYDCLLCFQAKYPQNDPVVAQHLQPILQEHGRDGINLRNGLWRIRYHFPPSPAQWDALSRAKSIVDAVAAIADFHADYELREGAYVENSRHRNRACCFREQLPPLFDKLAELRNIPLQKSGFVIGGAA